MRITDRAEDVPSVIGGGVRAHRSGPTAQHRRRVRVALLREAGAPLQETRDRLQEHAPEFEVVLAASSWLELVHSPLFPTDLVVVDVAMADPVSVAARVRTCRAAGAKVILLTDDEPPAGTAGTVAVVPRSQPLERTIAMARTVMGLDTAPAATWRPLPAAAEPAARPRLSLGEETALRLYASGLTTGAVAASMHVQFETAKTYLRRVREKYARVGRPASRRAELVERAVEDGFLQ